jgi:hypothetical protein
MIEGQQMMTEAAAREFPDACAWCGSRPTEPFQLEKARYGKAANGTRVLKRQPITAPACAVCRARFEAETSPQQKMTIK